MVKQKVKKSTEAPSKPQEGEKINLSDACVRSAAFKCKIAILTFFQKLKEICWGGSNTMPRPEWTKSGIIFHKAGKEGAFGLKTKNGASKGFQMILQSYILKHILFEGKETKKSTK